MVDKRSVGRDLSRLEGTIDEPEAGDYVNAYWAAVAEAIRDAEAGDERTPADLPDMMEFFPVGYDRDDALAAFDAEDATWGDAVKRAAQRRDNQDTDGTDDGTTEGEQDAQ